MNSTLSFCILLLIASVLCGCAWGKVVDLEEHGESQSEVVANKLQDVREALTHSKTDNLCLYKGEIFTIDVRIKDCQQVQVSIILIKACLLVN